MTIRILTLSLIHVLLISVICYAAPKNPDTSPSQKEWPAISLTLVTGGFNSPTHITHAGDGSKRLFITEQAGKILIIKKNKILKTPFLDINDRVGCCGERGLLSAAFPDNYSSKKYFYVNYTNIKGSTVIARYKLTSNPDIADIKSEDILLTIKQPFSNHNGGQMAFGPDGYLYIGTGDGGLIGDPFNNAQDRRSLLGKILRIDVESGKFPYAVPPDNPFLKRRDYRPEIWAIGLRNPWRFSFDRATGGLFIADVGENNYEEINFQSPSSKGGENYGWSILEGSRCFGSAYCNKAGLVIPVAEYDHSQGCSVTGGKVYRGKKFPSLQGIYFYADYCSGRIWGLVKSGTIWLNRLLINSGLSVTTFGEDETGEIYLADYSKGNIYRIEAR
jgi:glucose/arabinose dehydrogenase